MSDNNVNYQALAVALGLSTRLREIESTLDRICERLDISRQPSNPPDDRPAGRNSIDDHE